MFPYGAFHKNTYLGLVNSKLAAPMGTIPNACSRPERAAGKSQFRSTLPSRQSILHISGRQRFEEGEKAIAVPLVNHSASSGCSFYGASSFQAVGGLINSGVLFKAPGTPRGMSF